MKRRKNSGPNGEPLVGHPTALRWQCAPDAFNYVDENNKKLDGTLWAYGLELTECDAFIESLEAQAAGAGKELRQRREKMMTAYLGNNLDAMIRHAEWLMLRMREIHSAESVQPLVDLAVKVTRGADKVRERTRAEKVDRHELIRSAFRALSEQNPKWKADRVFDELAKLHAKKSGWSRSTLIRAVGPTSDK